MKIESAKGIEDVLLIYPDLHKDDRGYFYEVFNEKEFNEKTNNKYDFHALQENESKSSRYVFRGFHFQRPPFEQAKLVRVLSGTVVDFAVDIRKESPTFGKCVFALLSDKNKTQFFIPRGFAHAFLVLSETAVFEYKCDNYYDKESEGGIRWDDEDIEIFLPFGEPDYKLTAKEYMERLLTINANNNNPDLEHMTDLLLLSDKDKNRKTTLKDL